MSHDEAGASAPALPALVAARVQPGHNLEEDSTFAQVRRWTCTTCGASVLDSGSVIYGSATERPCHSTV